MRKGQTILYTTSFDNNERTGVIQEITTVGYLINNIWYAKEDLTMKCILIDSRTNIFDEQLILG